MLAPGSRPGWWRTRSGWQRIPRRMLCGKNCRRSVALMDVAVHRHRGTDFSVALQSPDCHGYIVDHAESLAVVREGMMKSTANVDGDAIDQSLPRRQHGSSGREP